MAPGFRGISARHGREGMASGNVSRHGVWECMAQLVHTMAGTANRKPSGNRGRLEQSKDFP